MKIPKLSKNKILIIALVVVAIVGFLMFRGSGEEESLTTVQTGLTGTIGQELVIEINRLRALQNIEGKIFKDPVFVSLEDYTQSVVPQPVGRSNPLAPIGTDF